MSGEERAEPQAGRPHMPFEYGIAEASEGMGLLAWSWAVERLVTSRCQWIATTRPDGSPHVMVVWGVWLDDRFYFATSTGSRKARNLVANPRCVVCTECAGEGVVVEGVGQVVADPAAVEQFRGAYRAKYQEDIDTSRFPVYVVRPRVAFGFISEAERWAGTMTRWRFGGEQ
jgi:PPOX class probable F420-dependent enzyme